jgi:nicotinate phosphoribosyltransferase
MKDTQIVASGDLNEQRIAELAAGGAPIDVWGVGTDLGTSRDAPAVGGVYKMVADRVQGDHWRPTLKVSPDKATLPGPKQVFRRHIGETMAGDVIGLADETIAGEPLLVPAIRRGKRVGAEPLERIRARATAELGALPVGLRELDPDVPTEAYPVGLSGRLTELADRIRRGEDEAAVF